MRRLRLLIAALILVYEGSVAAECAWVLWEENELLRTEKALDIRKWWELHGAYAMQAECVHVQQRVWEARANEWDPQKAPGVKEVKKVAPSLVIVNFKPDADGNPSSWTRRLLCLPDTIDPRK